MHLVDTHTHLESFARKGQLEPVLQRARDAGVGEMITIGTAPDDWDLYRDLARANPGFVHFTAGLHPCSVDGSWESALAGLEKYWLSSAEPKPVALGEMGLDRFHLPKDSPKAAEEIFAWQKSAFSAGLEIARRMDVPIVVHSRGAFSECVEMIDASGVNWSKVVFHCFVEGEAEITELNKRGGYGSFTGILTYKTAELVRAAAKRQGFDRFMLETDAPYLTPMPHRGKPNEPAFVKHTAEFAAALFGVSLEKLADQSRKMAHSFFGLD